MFDRADEELLYHVHLHSGASKPHDGPLRGTVRPAVRRYRSGGAVGSAPHGKGEEAQSLVKTRQDKKRVKGLRHWSYKLRRQRTFLSSLVTVAAKGIDGTACRSSFTFLIAASRYPNHVHLLGTVAVSSSWMLSLSSSFLLADGAPLDVPDLIPETERKRDGHVSPRESRHRGGILIMRGHTTG